MKTTAALGTATRTMGKLFFALLLLLVAIAVGCGGTALFVYHEFGNARRPAARGTVADHRPVGRPVQSVEDEGSLSLRHAAALPSDQPRYTYADNHGGQPTAPIRRARPAMDVPAALDPSSPGAADRLNEPPRAIVEQTPPPEVRVASPVLADGQPVYQRGLGSVGTSEDSQYLPIRKALPVAAGETNAVPRVFNAAEYMMNDQDRPVLRAQPVVPAGARVVRTLRIYRLPDGTQTLARD